MNGESKVKKTHMFSHTNMGQGSMLGRQRCTKYCNKVQKIVAFFQKLYKDGGEYWDRSFPLSKY